MVVLLGQMQLPAPQDPDPSDDYFNGTISGGGLWTALTRSSDHDHTGGVNGKPISVSSIPDGSITTSKLDPSVLLPYTLVDGSKPFTGQQAFNADTLVRDTLYFGAKPAGVADANLKRTGANAFQFSGNVGVGVAPAAWRSGLSVLQVQAASLRSEGVNAHLAYNTVETTVGGYTSIVNDVAVQAMLHNAGFQIRTAPPVGAGAAQTFTTRLAVAQNGTVTLTPDAGQTALLWNVAAGELRAGSGSGLTTSSAVWATGFLVLEATGNYVLPNRDNVVNLGSASFRYGTVFAGVGAINTSSQEAKDDIAPLDPAAAMAAVRATEAVTFVYKAPPAPEGAYELPDDPEQAEEALLFKLRNAPLEEAARHQAGFVAEQADPLFLTGAGQTSPGNSVGVLLAALQHLDTRLSALETP